MLTKRQFLEAAAGTKMVPIEAMPEVSLSNMAPAPVHDLLKTGLLEIVKDADESSAAGHHLIHGYYEFSGWRITQAGRDALAAK